MGAGGGGRRLDWPDQEALKSKSSHNKVTLSEAGIGLLSPHWQVTGKRDWRRAVAFQARSLAALACPWKSLELSALVTGQQLRNRRTASICFPHWYPLSFLPVCRKGRVCLSPYQRTNSRLQSGAGTEWKHEQCRERKRMLERTRCALGLPQRNPKFLTELTRRPSLPEGQWGRAGGKSLGSGPPSQL